MQRVRMGKSIALIGFVAAFLLLCQSFQPADLPKLSAEQKARLNTFTAGGGVIIRAGKTERRIAAHAETAAGGPRLSLEPRSYVLGQLHGDSYGRYPYSQPRIRE